MIQEAYVQGISTRLVDDLEGHGHERHLEVPGQPRLYEEVDGKVKAFLEQPIKGDWPYLWIDATYLKVHRGNRFLAWTLALRRKASEF